MARAVARMLVSNADRCRLIAPNLYVSQHFSRVERVTGIEPALSAWELFQLMGFVLGSLCSVVPNGLECPLDACRSGTLMARRWRFDSTGQNESSTQSITRNELHHLAGLHLRRASVRDSNDERPSV